MRHKKAIAEKLLQINAIILSPQQPFTWASGWKSPIYCDNRKILSFPAIREFVKLEMCNAIYEFFPNRELLAGVATAGIPWSAIVAEQLKLPLIYVRPKPKEHGLGNQIEGFYEPGKKAVIIEDLISTGKSSLQVVEVLRKESIKVLGVISIFDYRFDIAVTGFARANVIHRSLTDYDCLISLAIEKDLISHEDGNSLLNWRKDPSNWSNV